MGEVHDGWIELESFHNTLHSGATQSSMSKIIESDLHGNRTEAGKGGTHTWAHT